MSDLSMKSVPATSLTASVLRAIAAVFSSRGSAGSPTAAAVENRREAQEAALRKLSLEGARFKQYY